MKTIITFIVLFVLAEVNVMGQLSVVPYPNQVRLGKGAFILSQQTKIIQEGKDQQIALLLKQIIEELPHSSDPIANTIVIKEGPIGSSSKEAYHLEINEKQIEIKGQSAGLFYGFQTLLQLFPEEQPLSLAIPVVSIQDSPRFPYRGLMLDVSRHFFKVQQIKSLLDLMARYKLNVFHWHLTDDQGWRIEIKSLPKLTQVGARRVKRTGHFGGDIRPPQTNEHADDVGFYTQEEIRDIVRYAKERNIDVLPEIDMPGHSMAAIAAYPWLCVTKDTSIQVNPGSSFAKWFKDGHYEMYTDNTLDPTQETTYRFVDQVLTEVATLFPYEYIHIGGDECFKGYWEKSELVKDFMKQHKIADMHTLQAYFISRIHKIVQSKNKKMIGWDEILEGGFKGDAAVMNRFGKKTLGDQLAGKHPIVRAQGTEGFYFDYAQSNSPQEPINHGGNEPWQKSYAFDPMQGVDLSKNHNLIKGVEGCIWTEHIYDDAKLQYMMMPRILSLAETGWTAQTQKDASRFSTERLPRQLSYFDKKGYIYWVPPVFDAIDSTRIGERFDLKLKSLVPGGKIYFTMNGKNPTEADFLYRDDEPLIIDVQKGKKIALKTLVVTPAGRRSVVSSLTLSNL